MRDEQIDATDRAQAEQQNQQRRAETRRAEQPQIQQRIGECPLPADEQQTVLNIRSLLAAGLSTTTIADLLPCLSTGDGRLIADCPELLVDLYRERERIDAGIRDLEAARRALDTVIATAPPEVVHAVADLVHSD
ncbi:hypothetical protein NDR87_35545 [Nocardia sp. CDC159]|uniref:Uncharacterized protein n=1 Tax=Nocardia pulmonis TaxID=2951408 RepID=A0A9X2EHK5_9NOCA|nr:MULTISPECIES: hypothetical protein [Nocardia]MCM6778803.1 hypothetical protein [Nocardia pulmonis]MCM6791692.1 hypothetical protein [Nocardia sp. CDC159]